MSMHTHTPCAVKSEGAGPSDGDEAEHILEEKERGLDGFAEDGDVVQGCQRQCITQYLLLLQHRSIYLLHY